MYIFENDAAAYLIPIPLGNICLSFVVELNHHSHEYIIHFPCDMHFIIFSRYVWIVGWTSNVWEVCYEFCLHHGMGVHTRSLPNTTAYHRPDS